MKQFENSANTRLEWHQVVVEQHKEHKRQSQEKKRKSVSLELWVLYKNVRVFNLSEFKNKQVWVVPIREPLEEASSRAGRQ